MTARALPLRVPDDLAELAEATMLLGAWFAHGGALKASRQARIRALIGELPRSREECATWKSALKGYRKEMVEMDREEG